MPGRGPAPKPTALKALRGNPGRRRLNDREPQLPAASPEPPDVVRADLEAYAEWRRLTPLLAEVGLVTHADRAVLTAYCTAWSDFLRARVSGSGNERSVMFAHLRQIMPELGLTPAARSRIHVDKPKPADRVAAFQSKHG